MIASAIVFPKSSLSQQFRQTARLRAPLIALPDLRARAVSLNRQHAHDVQPILGMHRIPRHQVLDAAQRQEREPCTRVRVIACLHVSEKGMQDTVRGVPCQYKRIGCKLIMEISKHNTIATHAKADVIEYCMSSKLSFLAMPRCKSVYSLPTPHYPTPHTEENSLTSRKGCSRSGH